MVEAGHPHRLLQFPKTTRNESSGISNSKAGARKEVAATFASMVDETGPASAEHLRRLAKEAWEASASSNGDAKESIVASS